MKERGRYTCGWIFCLVISVTETGNDELVETRKWRTGKEGREGDALEELIDIWSLMRVLKCIHGLFFPIT